MHVILYILELYYL